ncbi:MAG: AAA family ATPase [Leptospirales bacterium]|nr:AAA family ATPase [Leptospirales bacterium]
MNGVAGYDTGDILFEDERAIFRSSVRQRDGARVLLKSLRQKRPEARDVALLRHEYELSSALPEQYALRGLSLEPAPNGFVLALATPCGPLLANSLAQSSLSIAEFLSLALALAASLEALHKAGIVHRSLSPACIFWNRESAALQVGDFRFAARLSLESSTDVAELSLEGPLAYLSPEQTGRMNRTVDHRADLYAAGATLYHALCGRPPFISTDPLELVHSHLARNPDAPLRSAAGEDVPPLLQALLLKLLKKAPEERYQSAAGLAADLRRAQTSLANQGFVTEFDLGEEDISDQLQIPQRLYGRDEQLIRLAEAFEAAMSGRRLVFLVTGASGLGKTALVNEMHKPIARRGGVFLSGKFDQLRRDQPYSALAEALQIWVRRLLSESSGALQQWRERLLSLLGLSGGALLEFIPELALVLGDQAPVAELPPAEAQNRLHHLFRNLVRALETPGRPLILFLDNLQWADRPTLDLLHVLMSDPDSGGIILFGAYREEEVGSDHPLRSALADIAAASVQTETLPLSPLSLDDTMRFLADAIQAPPGELDELARAFLERSAGNPFLMQELLRSLHREGKLYFDAESRRWRWDLAAVRSGGLSLDALALVQQRMDQLGPELQGLLLLCACMGAKFNLRLVSLAWGQSPLETLQKLLELAQAGLISPRDSSYKYVQDGDESAKSVYFSFLHDRFLQGARALFSEQKELEQRLRIGRTLLQHLSFAERDERIIEIVEHLNAARDLLTDSVERLQVAQLDLQAGRRAKRASAHEEALRFFAIGADFLPRNAVAEAYELYIQFEQELGATYYVLGDLPRSEKRFENVLRHARSGQEKLPVFETRVAVALGKDRPDLAVQAAAAACAELGVALDSSRRKERRRQSERLRKLLRLKRPEDWLRSKTLSGSEDSARLKSLVQLGMPARVIASPLYGESLAAILEIGKQGVAPAVAQAMASASSFVASELRDIECAELYGRTAIDLAEKLGAREVHGRILFEYAAFLQYWRNPVQQLEETLLQAARSAQETGDLVFAAQSYWLMLAVQLWTGCTPLDQLQIRIERHYNALFKTGQNFALELNGLFWQTTLNLAGAERNRTRLTGTRFKQDESERRWKEAGNSSGLFYSHFCRALLAGNFAHYDLAVEQGRLAEEFGAAVSGSLALPLLSFHHGVACAGLLRSEKIASRRRELSADFEKRQVQLADWRERSPLNFEHLHLLLVAEEARLAAEHGRAMECYDGAAQLARERGFLAHAAQAAELAARYFLDLGKARIAGLYMGDAVRDYRAAGYGARCSDIELEHAELLHNLNRQDATKGAPGPAPSGSALDALSVLKASQAISGELELGSLLQRMLRIVMENAGAQRAILALPREGELRIVAEGQVNRDSADVSLDLKLENSGRAPASLLRLAERTRQPAVIAEAFTEAELREDPYIQQNRVRSALSYPLLLQGQLLGVLYLENNSAAGAFSSSRQDALSMLATQMAASLENARLYSNLQQALSDERQARQEQTALTEAATRFVPSEFLQILGRSSLTQVELGQNIARQMSVLFSDIRGFTALSESMSPQENFEFINSYLNRIGPVVREHGGFIDKYIGDAVMALFAAPASALQSAIRMQQTVAEYNMHRARQSYAPIQVGIGLNSGDLMLGVIGEANRMEGTVISDAVNLASRLEGLTKIYGAAIILSESMVAGVEHAETRIRELDLVQVKGKKAPARIYEALPLGIPAFEKRIANIEKFEEARGLYLARDFAAAKKAFAAILTGDPSDLSARVFALRCQQLLQTGVPEDWDGVAIMRRK